MHRNIIDECPNTHMGVFNNTLRDLYKYTLHFIGRDSNSNNIGKIIKYITRKYSITDFSVSNYTTQVFVSDKFTKEEIIRFCLILTNILTLSISDKPASLGKWVQTIISNIEPIDKGTYNIYYYIIAHSLNCGYEYFFTAPIHRVVKLLIRLGYNPNKDEAFKSSRECIGLYSHMFCIFPNLDNGSKTYLKSINLTNYDKKKNKDKINVRLGKSRCIQSKKLLCSKCNISSQECAISYNTAYTLEDVIYDLIKIK